MARGPKLSTEQASPDQASPLPVMAEARGVAIVPPERADPARSPLPAARIMLDPDQVVVLDRLRPLNPDRVDALLVSYQDSGELPPIIVRPYDMDGEVPRFRLVAGLHRLEANRRMGLRVPATVRDLTDAEARIVECDENLLGPNLSPWERAVFIQARLEAWAARYPDRTREDGAPKRGRPRNSEKLSEFPVTMGFAEATAGEIGLSDKSVRNALSIYRGLTPASRSQVGGTWLAKNEGALRQLAAVADAEEQAAVLKVLVEGKTKSIPDARAIAAGNEPIRTNPSATDDFLSEAQKLWKKAGKSQREALLDWLAGQALPPGWSITHG